MSRLHTALALGACIGASFAVPALAQDARIRTIAPADGARYVRGEKVDLDFQLRAELFGCFANANVRIATRADLDHQGLLQRRWTVADYTTWAPPGGSLPARWMSLPDKPTSDGWVPITAFTGPEDWGSGIYWAENTGPEEESGNPIPVTIPKPADGRYFWQAHSNGCYSLVVGDVRTLYYGAPPGAGLASRYAARLDWGTIEFSQRSGRLVRLKFDLTAKCGGGRKLRLVGGALSRSDYEPLDDEGRFKLKLDLSNLAKSGVLTISGRLQPGSAAGSLSVRARTTKRSCRSSGKWQTPT